MVDFFVLAFLMQEVVEWYRYEGGEFLLYAVAEEGQHFANRSTKEE